MIGQPVFGPLTRADAECVASWVTSPSELLMFAGPALSFPITAEAFLATATDSWWLFGLSDESCLVGTGSVGIKNAGVARIGRVLVNPDRRGEGWGRVLVGRLLHTAATLPGVETITLGVFEQNLAARALYESMGFVDTGARTTTDVEGTWTSVQMALNLHSMGSPPANPRLVARRSDAAQPLIVMASLAMVKL